MRPLHVKKHLLSMLAYREVRLEDDTTLSDAKHDYLVDEAEALEHALRELELYDAEELGFRKDRTRERLARERDDPRRHRVVMRILRVNGEPAHPGVEGAAE